MTLLLAWVAAVRIILHRWLDKKFVAPDKKVGLQTELRQIKGFK